MQPDLMETDLTATEPEQTETTDVEPGQTESGESEPVQTAFVQPELVETGKLQRDLEALLFVASEPLSMKQLAKLTRAEETDVSLALQKIEQDFAERGIVVRFAGGGYRFATSPAARDAVEAYLMPPKTNLSAAALETLAIVAYMQPVTKGEVEGIRGVSADSVIATLVDRRFLTDAGKRDTPGRPTLYKTTPEFLEAFGLRSLDELPPVDVDGALPLELALPIPTAAVPPATSGEASTEAAADEDSRDEIVAETMTLDRVENHPPQETAVGETIVAEEETEPQPSPEPQASTA